MQNPVLHDANTIDPVVSNNTMHLRILDEVIASWKHPMQLRTLAPRQFLEAFGI